MDHKRYYRELSLESSQFDHSSQLHGIGHTYRVMVLVYKLCHEINEKDMLKPALAAAFLHDMARQHDGYCTLHGLWAAQQKLPLFYSFFLSHGISEDKLESIAQAITWHSRSEEIDSSDKAFRLTALLKDADALDRIRLSEENLDTRFLRFPESKTLILFARNFYFAAHKLNFHNFAEALKFAELINQK